MKLPPEIQSQIPPQAVLIAKKKTRLGITFSFKHIIDGWEVDGDRQIIKLRKGSPPQVEVVEKTWNEVTPPFPVPPKKPDRKAMAILVDSENPFYIWVKKPPRFSPVWFIPKGAELTILDMDGEVIGYGTPPPV